eukprot:1157285-Pelagomonas_calceolata.AAC.1
MAGPTALAAPGPFGPAPQMLSDDVLHDQRIPIITSQVRVSACVSLCDGEPCRGSKVNKCGSPPVRQHDTENTCAGE